MAKKNNFNKKYIIKPNSVGYERRQEISDDISQNTGFLPVGIHLKDIDQAFVDFITSLKIKGEVVVDKVKTIRDIPVIFLTNQKWSEFSRTWEFTNELKEISLPFITIIRKPDTQIGTGQNGYYNIPGRQSWVYYKVPTNDGGRLGVDNYKIPQPTAVDLNYEVRVFSNKLVTINSVNEKIFIEFDSLQRYINVLKHPMPIKFNSNNDESTLNDFENRRMYINMFDMTVQGYILDESEFEIIPSINRVVSISEIKG
jgi:hypothetical protein